LRDLKEVRESLIHEEESYKIWRRGSVEIIGEKRF